MEDAYSRDAEHHRIVDKRAHSPDGLVASHAAHIDVGLEVELALLDGLACGACDIGGRRGGLALGGGSLDEPLIVDHDLHGAEYDGGLLAADVLEAPYRGLSLDAHIVAGLRAVGLGASGRSCGGRLTASGGRRGSYLLAALFAALATAAYLLHLAGYGVFLIVGIDLGYLALEIFELTPHLACPGLLGLHLTDGADGILDLGIRGVEQLLCVFLGLGHHIAACGLQLLHLLLIFGDDLLQTFLLLVHLLPLVLPVAFVAHYVEQIFVAVHIVLPHYLRGVVYHILRDADLAGYLDGERTARLAYLEAEERLHLLPVVEHGAVHHSRMAVGVALQVLVVGGDDAVRARGDKPLEDGLRERAAYLRLRAAAKLVDEQQRPGARVFHHVLHIEQVRGVGAQLIGDALLVADINEHSLEHARARVLPHGHTHATLQHVLQQADGLQAYRLAAGVRARDEKYAPDGRELHIEWHSLAATARQLLRQQRMDRLDPVDSGRVAHIGLHGVHRLGQQGLGADEVDLAHEVIARQHIVYLGAHIVGKFLEDPEYLPLLGALQLPYPVVRLHHLGRLDEYSLAGGRLVVDDAPYLALQSRLHGDHQTPVAYGGRHVLVQHALLLGGGDDVAQGVGQAAPRALYL